MPLKRSPASLHSNGPASASSPMAAGQGYWRSIELIDCKGELAALSPATIERLNAVLPPTWSRANPVDIIGDAPPERYKVAIEAVAADPGTDVVLVMNCPTGLGSPLAAASAVAEIAREGTIDGKPVLTCWLGEHTARAGRQILQDAGIASFETPADAAMAVSYLSEWSRAQQALMRTPSSRSEDITCDREAVLAIFRQIAKDGRRMLTEPEAKAAISAYGIPVPETIVAKSPAEAEAAAGRLLKTSEQVVVKLVSKAISHKSDIGGVVLNIADAAAAGKAARSIAGACTQARTESRY